MAHTPAEEVLTSMTSAIRLVPYYLVDTLPDLVARHGDDVAADFLCVDRQTVHDAVRVIRLGAEHGWTVTAAEERAARC